MDMDKIEEHNTQESRNSHNSGEAAMPQTLAELEALLAASTPVAASSMKERIEARVMAEFELVRGSASSAQSSVHAHAAEEAASMPSSAQTGIPIRLERPGTALPASLVKRRLNRVTSLAMGGLGIVLLLVLFFGMSALLKSRLQGNVNPVPVGVADGAEAQYLLSIPFSASNTVQVMIAGFGVAEDGTFWIIGEDKRLQHYDSNGKLLGIFSIPMTLIYDLKVYDKAIWIYDGTSVSRYSYDGQLLSSYNPFAAQSGLNTHYPAALNASEMLRPTNDGQMLLEAGYNYVPVADQVLTADGTLDPPSVHGYPAYGELYQKVVDSPNVLLAGDMRITVQVPGDIYNMHMLKVMPDKSFYLLVDTKIQDQSPGQSSHVEYVVHYGADGALIERARLPAVENPEVVQKQLGISEDGTFYLANLTFKADGLPLGYANIFKLNFYKASSPLPATSTPDIGPAVPTPLPTAPVVVAVASPVSTAAAPLPPPGQVSDFVATLRQSASWQAAQSGDHDIAWSADKTLLAVASSSDVTLRDVATGQVQATFKPDLGPTWVVRGVSWSPDGRVLAVVGYDTNDTTGKDQGYVLLLDPAKNLSVTDTITEHNMVLQVAWSPNSRTLAYTDGWQIDQWDIAQRQLLPRPVATWPAPATAQPDPNTTFIYNVNSLAWSPDGNWLAISQGGVVRVTDSNGKELWMLPVPAGKLAEQVVWAPDGHSLAALLAQPNSGTGLEVTIWDDNTGKVLRTITPPTSPHSIGWSSHANVLAVGLGDMQAGDGGRVLFYDPTTGENVGQTAQIGDVVDNLVWSADGQMLAAGSASNQAVVVFAPGTGPTPTQAPVQPTVTPVPTAITPIPVEGGPTDVARGVPGTLPQLVAHIQQIQMVDANTGWAKSSVNDYPDVSSALLKTVDGARTWSIVTPFPDRASQHGSVLLAMHFVDANVGWAVSGVADATNVNVYRTTDGGTTWNSSAVITRYLFAQPYAPVSLDFLNAKFGWMMVWGAGGMSSTLGQLFATDDGGLTWSEVASSDSGALPCAGEIKLRDENAGWLVCSQASTAPKALYMTHDGGKTWSEQALQFSSGADPTVSMNVLDTPKLLGTLSLSGVTQNIAVVFVNSTYDGLQPGAEVFISWDGGDTWRGWSAIPFLSSGIAFFLDVDHWWAWGALRSTPGAGVTPVATASSPSNNGALYRTTDGNQAWTTGADWEQVYSADTLQEAASRGYELSQLDFATPDVGYAVFIEQNLGTPAFINTTLLFKTTDGGQTWVALSQP